MQAISEETIAGETIAEETISKETLAVGGRSSAGQVSEQVLLFREGPVNMARRAHKRYSRRLRHAQRRALLRRLSHVTAQLERTPEYRQSLQRLLDLGGQLQSVLDASQRERWLALEEALFDHSSHLQRAYFRAGVEYGRSRALGALVSGDETVSRSKIRAGVTRHSAAVRQNSSNAGPAALELEIVSALARWLGKL
jgi:hypothetical protein